MAYIVNSNFPDELLNERDVNWQTDGSDPEHGVVLQWTTTPPTQGGLYKARQKGVGTLWVEVWSLSGGWLPLIKTFGSDVDSGLEDFTHWLGPLPEPEPPTEGE